MTDALLDTMAGNYRLVAKLGAGGMGEVYKAIHATIGSKVAIKVLHGGGDPGMEERFLREAKAVNLIEHDGVVKVVDVGRLASGRPFLVMELLEGRSLSELQRAGALSIAAACTVMADVLDALDAAHRVGVIHRDLKPANVFQTKSGRTVVLDFGIAKLLTGSSSARLTMMGSAVGTPHYMAPEQITDGAVGPAADIYTAGVVLFELLCQRLPFEGSTVHIMNGHLEQRPPPARVFRPELPLGISDVILKAMQKDPAMRFPSAGAMRDALRVALQDAIARGELVGRDASPAIVLTPAADSLAPRVPGPATPATSSERPRGDAPTVDVRPRADAPTSDGRVRGDAPTSDGRVRGDVPTSDGRGRGEVPTSDGRGPRVDAPAPVIEPRDPKTIPVPDTPRVSNRHEATAGLPGAHGRAPGFVGDGRVPGFAASGDGAARDRAPGFVAGGDGAAHGRAPGFVVSGDGAARDRAPGFVAGGDGAAHAGHAAPVSTGRRWWLFAIVGIVVGAVVVGVIAMRGPSGSSSTNAADAGRVAVTTVDSGESADASVIVDGLIASDAPTTDASATDIAANSEWLGRDRLAREQAAQVPSMRARKIASTCKAEDLVELELPVEDDAERAATRRLFAHYYNTVACKRLQSYSTLARELIPEAERIYAQGHVARAKALVETELEKARAIQIDREFVTKRIAMTRLLQRDARVPEPGRERIDELLRDAATELAANRIDAANLLVDEAAGTALHSIRLKGG